MTTFDTLEVIYNALILGTGPGMMALLRERYHDNVLLTQMNTSLRMRSFMLRAGRASIPGRERIYYFSNTRAAHVLNVSERDFSKRS